MKGHEASALFDGRWASGALRYHAGSSAPLSPLCFEEVKPHGETMQSSSWQFPAIPNFLVIPVQMKEVTRLFQPHSFKSLPSIHTFPAETPDIMKQRQAILSGPCPNSWANGSICIIIIIIIIILLLFYANKLWGCSVEKYNFFFLIYLYIFGCVGSSFLCEGFL